MGSRLRRRRRARTSRPAACGDSDRRNTDQTQCARKLDLLPGGAARRHGRQPVGVRSDRCTRPQPRDAATRSCSTCVSRATSRTRSMSTGSTEPVPTASRDPAAAGAAGGALLHQLAASADHRRARARGRARKDRAVQGLLRRVEDPHDDRPADAAGGAGGDRRRVPAGLQRPDGGAGDDRQPDRRGPRDGQRRR